MTRVLLLATVLSVFGLSLAAGNRAFQDGRYEDAVVEYRRALARGDDSPVLRYNLGTALLRLGRYDEGREHLELGARSDEARVRQPAHYNSGNTDLEPSFVAAPSAERTSSLRRSIAHYQQALLLDPTDTDAKWNLELAQQLLAEQAGGGGGGGEDEDPQQGGGGGGEGADAPAQPDATPSPGDGRGAQPQMTQEQAEQVLRQAVERERELQHEKLRRTSRPPPNVRDW
jgi:tetratricopeptide (TPR) repeat protein